MCANLGTYQNTTFKCDCCCPEKVSEMAQEINIGPTMFLMSTKQITKFFFLLMVINMPLIIFFYETSEEVKGCNDLPCYFEHMGIGSVGEMQNACGSKKHTDDGNITIKCDSELGRIFEIKFIGVGLNETSTCPKAMNTKRADAVEVLEEQCHQKMDIAHREDSVRMSDYADENDFWNNYNLFKKAESTHFFNHFV